MKKLVLMVVVLMLFASTAMAYNFGHVKIDQNVSMQRMTFSELYPSMKPLFFGNKPNFGIMHNNKNSNLPFLQIGIDDVAKGIVMTKSSDFGFTINEGDPASDDIFFGIMYSDAREIFMMCDTNGCDLEADGPMQVRAYDSTLTVQSKSNMSIISEDGNITLTPDATGLVRIAGETLIDEANTLTLTQEDVGATCSLGQIRLDTGGATKELCYCESVNSWVCAALGALAD